MTKDNSKRGRVQFSAEELEILGKLVRLQIEDRMLPEPVAENLAKIMIKVNRARNRLTE